MPKSIKILKWFKDEDCGMIIYVNVIYLSLGSINLIHLMFKQDEFEKFKKSRKKSEYLQNLIISNSFLFDEDITCHQEISEFLKVHKLENVIRNVKLNSLLKSVRKH